ncbi:MAG: hypothetical protein HYW22_01825 [Candidatus Aenigmarchaeota archaeon]|nr:hypothetical protein [Candidatus Aenigmarchaeota archaeon]
MKKLLFISFMLGFLVSTSIANAAIQVTIPSNVVVYTGETTDINVKITNTGSQDTFSLNVFPPQLEKVSASADSFLITLNGNSETVVKVHFTVAIDTDPVSRSFVITAKSVSNPTITDTQNIVLQITRKTPVYVRDMSLDNYNLNPGGNVTVNADVFNLDDTNSAQYFLKVTVAKNGDVIKTFNRQVDSIPPRSTYRFSDMLTLDKYASPGTYTVNADIRDVSNNLKYSTSTTFSVNTVTQPSTEYIHKSTGFNIVTSYVTMTIKNDGNVILPGFELTDSIPNFAQILFSPSIEPSSKQSVDGREVYSWGVPALQPGEQYTVSYSFALWRVWIVLIVIGAGVYLFYKSLATPVIQKGMRHIGTITRGKEVMILIEVRNKALHEIKDVEVVDVVPHIAKVIESFETLKPKISKAPHGTLVRWNLGNLKPREERVVTYKIKSLVDVSGPLNLPPAEILYTDRGQNRRSIASKQALTKA